MLSVRNLEGIEEPFIDFTALRRKRKVNGEKTISLTILNSKSNEHAFHLIEEESIINFDNDEYVIKIMSEKAIGKTSIKQVEAIHKFYVDLINKQQPNIHNGSITFQNYMEMVFEGTGYSFITIDPFYARSFENLGDDNRLALLKKGLERFKAEMELVGNQVRFRQQVGNVSDFQFRYGHNIKTIERKVDTKNLATVIRGYGDPELGIEEYHRSDNADIFGELDAPTVRDERFKSNETLLEEMIGRLQDTPEFSITIDFIELRAAGYPYTIPHEGDSVFVIYEPMQDLFIDTRILEIEEDFDINLKPIKTNVTLANYKKSFTGTLFDNIQKQLDGFLDDDGVIKYNALDEAVRIATEALQSAQTELIFDNGIVAREKEDPNQLVVYNSKGLGISSDGGQTFREAITSEGFVLSAGVIGRLSANHIQIGPDTEFESGYDPAAIKREVDGEISDILENLDDLDDYIDTAFKDGIIEESEALAIEKYINSLNAEKADIDAQYSSIYTNGHLDGAAKTNLLNAKVNYNGAHIELLNAINTAIADGKTTPAEKANVDNRFTIYRNTLSALSTRFEQALDNIAQNKADVAENNAINYTDEHLNDFEDYIDNAFHDGVIEEAEAKAIESYLNTLEADHDGIIQRVNSVLNNDHIGGEESLGLALGAYVPYQESYEALVDSINGAIADGKTTPAEKADVDAKFVDYRGKLTLLMGALEDAVDSISRNKVNEADERVRDNLNLTAPLPTSIRLNSSGITAVTSNPNRYARLDYRGLYVRGGAIQIDGGLPDNQIASADDWNTQGTYIDQRGIYTGTVTANQVSVGWNNISQRVKISSTGLETYSGLQRTSLLDHRGHRFYRDETLMGIIGTAGLHSFPNLRGLNFQLSNEAYYMAWSHLENPGDPYYSIKLGWYADDSAYGKKGFHFDDDVSMSRDVSISRGVMLGSNQQASLVPYSNAVSLEFGSHEITLFDSGNVSFRSGSSSNHTFFASGTKNGGHIEVDNKKLGMSPVDSPQILIEYIEFNVEISQLGTKVMLDEDYLKTVSDFAAFTNKGELVKKGSDFVILKGEGLADIRFVGKRVNYDNVFWGDMEDSKGVMSFGAKAADRPSRKLVNPAGS